jgi:diacylglycerol kinase (ATP)
VIYVISNPAAGSGAADRSVELTESLRRAGRDVVGEPTRSRGDARRIAADAAARGAEAVVAVGGDGTVREAAAGLAGTGVPLAVLPAGTENVAARCFGLPTDPHAVADAVLAGRTRTTDLGWAAPLGDGSWEPPRPARQPFLCVAGVGLDAEILARLERCRRGPITRSAYLGPMAGALAGHRWPRLGVTIDGRPVSDRAGIVVVSNTARYAFGLGVCPEAVPDDGRLDAAVIECRGLADLAGIAVATLTGRLAGRRGCRHLRAATVEVRGPPEVAYQCDGDVCGRLPAEFTVQPSAVRLLVPAAGPGGP